MQYLFWNKWYICIHCIIIYFIYSCSRFVSQTYFQILAITIFWSIKYIPEESRKSLFSRASHNLAKIFGSKTKMKYITILLPTSHINHICE